MTFSSSFHLLPLLAWVLLPLAQLCVAISSSQTCTSMVFPFPRSHAGTLVGIWQWPWQVATLIMCKNPWTKSETTMGNNFSSHTCCSRSLNDSTNFMNLLFMNHQTLTILPVYHVSVFHAELKACMHSYSWMQWREHDSKLLFEYDLGLKGTHSS